MTLPSEKMVPNSVSLNRFKGKYLQDESFLKSFYHFKYTSSVNSYLKDNFTGTQKKFQYFI